MSFYDHLTMRCNIVHTNATRLTNAMDQLHAAVSAMDNDQLRNFKRTDIGAMSVSLAELYAQHSACLRREF